MVTVIGEPIKLTYTSRVSTEEQAIKAIEEYKDNQLKEGFALTKSSYVLKTKKSKGEVIDSWYIVTVECSFDI